MTMTIFLVLNGLGVAFLLYVLANFWKEGHRAKNSNRKYATEFGQRDWADVLVVTHPISHNAQGGLSVIPSQPRNRYSDTRAHRATSSVMQEMPVRRFSTK
jgi:hypothetical protein